MLASQPQARLEEGGAGKHLGDVICTYPIKDMIECEVENDDVTGQYMCVVEPHGELYVAAQQMDISQRINGKIHKKYYKNAAAILIDFNLSRVSFHEIAVKRYKIVLKQFIRKFLLKYNL